MYFEERLASVCIQFLTKSESYTNTLQENSLTSILSQKNLHTMLKHILMAWATSFFLLAFETMQTTRGCLPSKQNTTASSHDFYQFI